MKMKTKQIKLDLDLYKELKKIKGRSTFSGGIKEIITNYKEFKRYLLRLVILKKKIKTIRNTKDYLLVDEEKDLFIDNIMRGDIK